MTNENPKELQEEELNRLIGDAVANMPMKEKLELYNKLKVAPVAPKQNKHVVKYVWAIAAVLILLMGLYILLPSRAVADMQRIPVLTYHSVMPMVYYHPINVDNPWILREDTFYQQMRYLYENGFNTVTSNQLVDFLFYEGELPPNPIILTFDDGYLDNMLFAAPILRQFGQTAMLFIVTDYIKDYPQTMVAYPMQYLSWCEVSTITDVFEIGSHAHAMHSMVDDVPMLVSGSMEDILADLLKSFSFPLTFTTGFAYPYGRYSRNALLALEEAGVRFAFTTREDYMTIDMPPLLLPRFSVFGGPDGTTMNEFSQIVRGER